MALQKAFVSPYDSTTQQNGYHKIWTLHWDFKSGQIMVIVKSFVAQQYQVNSAMLTRTYIGDQADVFSGTGGLPQRIYNWLKTLPDFSAAVDI